MFPGECFICASLNVCSHRELPLVWHYQDLLLRIAELREPAVERKPAGKETVIAKEKQANG